jgi:hypothetical protein
MLRMCTYSEEEHYTLPPGLHSTSRETGVCTSPQLADSEVHNLMSCIEYCVFCTSKYYTGTQICFIHFNLIFEIHKICSTVLAEWHYRILCIEYCVFVFLHE